MNERRLHPFTVLRFLRKTLVVYLLPLVQVLFERNWTALHTALRQDALLFLLLCAVSWGCLLYTSTARCSGGQTKQNPSPSATASADSHKNDHRRPE